MISAQYAPTHRAQPGTVHTARARLPEHYCPLPQRLLIELHDTPLAIGLYALIGRQYLLTGAPVPLSRGDVMRFDPSLKPGAVRRAFERLLAAKWLIKDATTSKHGYTPTWGIVRNEPLPWTMGAPSMGRLRHIKRLALDSLLFDVCMGKLSSHPTRDAVVTRYVSIPALRLADIGSYSLTLSGIPRPTPQLIALGLIRDHEALPLPSEAQLLARLSQQAILAPDSLERPQPLLTTAGTRRLGVRPTDMACSSSQFLFFVPPDQAASWAPMVIGEVIGETPAELSHAGASGSTESPLSSSRQKITWDDQDKQDEQESPQPPSGGNGSFSEADRESRKTGVIPETAATQRLRQLHIRPEALIRHAHTSLTAIEAAIQDADARGYVNDKAGWVVSLLDDVLRHGHTIAPIRQVREHARVTHGGWDAATVAAMGGLFVSAPGDNASPADDIDHTTEVVDLASLLYGELLWRCPGAAVQRTIRTLSIDETPERVLIGCPTREAFVLVQQKLYVHLRAALEANGRHQPLTVLVMPSRTLA